eukprot:Gb_38196 [translate_table: standard]
MESSKEGGKGGTDQQMVEGRGFEQVLYGHAIEKEVSCGAKLVDGKECRRDKMKLVKCAIWVMLKEKNMHWPVIDECHRKRFPKNGNSASIEKTSTELGLLENNTESVKEPVACDLWKELLLSFPVAL